MNSVKKIIIKKKKLKAGQAFKVTYEDVSETDLIFIKLIDRHGNFGLGSVACDTHVTGEKISDVLRFLKAKLTNDFFDLPLDSWYSYHQKIQKTFGRYLSAQFAVEQAVLDLWSKNCGISLPIFFGGYRQSFNLMFSVGLKSLAETESEVKRKLAEGFKIIKLKVGENLANDLERIKLVRKIMPSNFKLTLDANRGYSFADAKKLFKAINKLKISLIEEPLKKSDLPLLTKLRPFTKIPIIADESTVGMRLDSEILLGKNWDGINIKLINCGGPINFLNIFQVAKSLNKIVMIGCTFESNISMTAGANLALGLPVDFIDLDSGHLDFAADPTTGGAEVKNGVMKISSPLIAKGF
jgi:L-Ala-D/L-Glu epimerase